MCAHQPLEPSRQDDEERRERVDQARDDETLGDDQVKRIARKHLPWSDWLRGEFAQYWYWLVVLAADLFVLMDVAQQYHVKDSVGILALLAIFVGLAIVEYLIFVRIWPESDKWKDRRR